MVNEIVVIGGLTMREDVNMEEYNTLLAKMYKIVGSLPGFQSVKKYKADDGEIISLYRFDSEESLEAWRTHPEHVEAMKRGHADFYASGFLQICKVIRESRVNPPQGQ
ncbi:antibiotic biosynthesis monooxygenase family protein [Limnohabitans radicicola]|uniref:Antibiotic biosynthesis monooxygenase n=1 Tax=Limnohabitans radicicola TaxID=2771427 RepID=A0A927FI88_9BURK|nr:antibiotic biosynthesis monooxygenase [Limnohabitans radicicola]MBD8050533.1 antibiotic biosynthesis monooxygenase [Limnohabitans radicicola]